MSTFGVLSQAGNRFVTNFGVFTIDHYEERDTKRVIYKLSFVDNVGRESLLGRFPSYDATLAEMKKVCVEWGKQTDGFYYEVSAQ